ncbi:MAG: tetratricopeptide repeat protein [Ruminococcaceae bacterium]|nr:tetratricopeptide repeat protein [Oscillospiraceae bacterium]
MKKLSVLLALLMLLTMLPVSAAEPVIPDAFWALNDRYIAAMNTLDNPAIIESTKGIINVFAGRWDMAAVSNISVKYLEMGNAYMRMGRYEDMAKAYEASFPYYEKYDELGLGSSVEILRIMHERIADWYESIGNYEKAAEYYAKTIGYYEKYPAAGLGDPAESITGLAGKVRYYTPTLELYHADDEPQVYYGAINEPEMGVLWGVAADGGVRDQIPNESLTLIYQEFGTPDSGYNARLLKEAEKSGLAVEFALNLPGEGAQLAEVLKSRRYVMDVIKLLNSVDVPIFLRFGAEMDTWTTPADPAAFIEAFRFVAELVHEHTDHVAMVWSPTYGRAWMMDVHAFYPGDDYVDWIGISLYLNAHPFGRTVFTEQELRNFTYFMAGDAAEPVRIMEELITAYGDRKPFIISESGASHRYRIIDGKSTSHDETDWAIDRLSELYYNLPMVYPQIKAIAHFDVVRPTEYCDYALSSNAKLTEQYLTWVKDGMFIQDSHENKAKVSWKKAGADFTAEQGVCQLRTMAFYYGKSDVTVTYLLDGKEAASADNLPYTAEIDLSSCEPGEHTITVRAFSGEKLLGEKTYTVTVTKPAQILVNGKKPESGAKPVMANDVPLVPLAEVMEMLGKKLVWNEKNGTATITNGTTRIKVTVGSSDMKVGSKTVKLAAAPRLVGNAVYVPLAVIERAAGAKTNWNSTDRTVTITL